jgi:hypothetical protein
MSLYLKPESNPNVRLSGIPPDLQEKYDIGSELDVELIADGFYVKFVNKKGKPFRVDPTEFYVPGIKHTDLRAPYPE